MLVAQVHQPGVLVVIIVDIILDIGSVLIEAMPKCPNSFRPVHLAKFGVLSSDNPRSHGHPASIVLRQRAPGDHGCLFVFVFFIYFV